VCRSIFAGDLFQHIDVPGVAASGQSTLRRFSRAIIKDKIFQCDANGLGVVYRGQAYVGEPAREAFRGSAQVTRAQKFSLRR
jgi:hypothetical protein